MYTNTTYVVNNIFKGVVLLGLKNLSPENKIVLNCLFQMDQCDKCFW